MTRDHLQRILDALPGKTIGLIGDLFLDRYLEIDPALDEPSIETGLTAYQVTRVRSVPGALGTVMNNLVALGVGRIIPITLIGDDGEGYELRQALAAQLPIVTHAVRDRSQGRTPTYTKPLRISPNGPPVELNRLDIKNRQPTPPADEQLMIDALEQLWPTLDALMVLDQVSEPNCGVITTRVRQRISELASENPERFVLADSRELFSEFRDMAIKPNRREALSHVPEGTDFDSALRMMSLRSGGLVFGTDSEQGIRLVTRDGTLTVVPGYPVTGPIDPVGAGDSTSAGILCGMAVGATPEQAAALGNLVASITVQQIGTTGTATPEQVLARWDEVTARNSS
ncbi:bifunctional heptose 7-phosphate kinase/heptose 1-phosphate adenyltransferase [Tuwongella immobilis]|uniref:Carbohydrate kinase PfkB domain-containing protein n=1 Tax=Tuwongella immobilis TaxID=692036 RepID=A0A6C2YH48_9BACT|nr:PfkB family carbohydrate kinase [Tuwongella immobilis]VIP00737.1 domain protein : PfkB domain protein OS=Treponema azotonutricium (strain ATCC BAA-888 / DSM 13862 / ZAS-9) GN=TREAZ_1017 PE=4 SV=1: PfkB [Tuwongella immobilis]VTR96892.1 domain protein : PfkB domain protein OS=Treponema azotonutricium (strain ATCC BAA-888 / DSM 13862 / ZAS-9) GN=TREAZ_1017 PE=4 SV=1: PfkB [Tuwongella immobilis]